MMVETIEVVPYRPDWPHLFEKESRLIKQALGDNCVGIHHVGSTAIPGLSAKPIIDMIPVVRDILQVDSAAQRMEALGYEVQGECGMLFRRFFQKGRPNRRTYHVHVYEEGNPETFDHALTLRWADKITAKRRRSLVLRKLADLGVST